MHKLTVKNESSPERCEICHKADYLEPNNTVCLRCQDINVPLAISKFNFYKEDDQTEGFFFSFNRTKTTRVVAGVLALLFSTNILGIAGTGLLLGGICSILGLLGIKNLTSVAKINTQLVLEFIFNLLLLGGGLSCSYFSGIHLLKWTIIR